METETLTEHRITLTLGTLRVLRNKYQPADLSTAEAITELLRVTEDMPADTAIYITPDACGVEQRVSCVVGSEP